jgi:hypothetical protein
LQSEADDAARGGDQGEGTQAHADHPEVEIPSTKAAQELIGDDNAKDVAGDDDQDVCVCGVFL